MLKPFRKLALTALFLSLIVLTAASDQAAASISACCQNCLNTWAACVNACGCNYSRDGAPACDNAYASCSAQCLATTGSSCPIV